MFLKGRIVSASVRRKLSAAHRGVPKSSEHKAKLAAATKRRWIEWHKTHHAQSPEVRRAYGAAYRAKNKEACAERSKRWAIKNAAHLKAVRAEYKRKHRKALRIYMRDWCAKNREKLRLRSLRRAGLKTRAAGTCGDEALESRVAYYGNRCAYCGGPYEAIDHVIPLSRGGANWPANLRPACKPCNSSKGHKKLLEWRQQKVTP